MPNAPSLTITTAAVVSQRLTAAVVVALARSPPGSQPVRSTRIATNVDFEVLPRAMRCSCSAARTSQHRAKAAHHPPLGSVRVDCTGAQLSLSNRETAVLWRLRSGKRHRARCRAVLLLPASRQCISGAVASFCQILAIVLAYSICEHLSRYRCGLRSRAPVFRNHHS